MRVSTTYLHQQLAERMSASAGELAKLQANVASGLKYNRPSEAPDIVGRVQSIESRIEGLRTDVDSVARVRVGVDAQASALESAVDLMSRVRTLVVQGSSQQYSDSEREAIAEEINVLKRSLLDLANSRDADGRYVFAGTRSAETPYALQQDGYVTYEGAANPLRVQVSDAGFEDATVSGPEVWRGTIRNGTSVDFFAVLNDLEIALRDSDNPNIGRALVETDDLFDNLNNSLSRLGATQQRLALAQSQAEELTIRAQEVLSSVKDLDYADALSRLKQQEVLLQASQSLMARLSQLSLLDVMR